MARMDVPLVLRQARGRAGLAQRALAARTGVPRSGLVADEGGAASPTATVLDRLLAGCGLQLPSRLEPLLADVDAQLERMLAGPVELHAKDIARLATSLEDRDDQKGLWPAHRLDRAGPVAWAFDGASGLAAQGLAALHPAPQIVVVLDEALRFWLRAVGLRGEREGDDPLDEGWPDVDPEVLRTALPGLRLCRLGVLQVRVVDELPPLLRVVLPLRDPDPDHERDPDFERDPDLEHDPDPDPGLPEAADRGLCLGARSIEVPVLPLHEVESARPDLHRVLSRHR